MGGGVLHHSEGGGGLHQLEEEYPDISSPLIFFLRGNHFRIKFSLPEKVNLRFVDEIHVEMIRNAEMAKLTDKGKLRNRS